MSTITSTPALLVMLLFMPVLAAADEHPPDPTVTPFLANPQRLSNVGEAQQVDYVALANAVLSEDVTPENNAAVVIATLMREADWGRGPAGSFRLATLEKLGVEPLGSEAVQFMDFDAFVDEAADVDVGERGETQWQRAQARPWHADELPIVAVWLAQQEPALDQLAEGVQRERYWMPWVREHEGDTVMELRLPALGFVRSLARTLLVRANQRLADEDVEGAIQDLLTMKRLAHAFKEAPLTIEQLVGMSIVAMAEKLTAALLAEPTLTVDQARTLLGELVDMSGRFPYDRALDIGARLEALDLVARLPVSERAWDIAAWDFNKPEGLNVPQWIRDPWLAEAYFAHDRAVERVNQTFDALTVAANMPGYIDRQEAMRTVAANVALSAEDVTAAVMPWGMASLLGPEMSEAERRERFTDLVTGLLLDMLVPALDTAETTATHIGMLGNLQLVAIALAGYRAENGHYPDSVEALIPDWLDRIPVDAFDPASQPVRYRLEPEQVVLYSLGRNGQDNGGIDTGSRAESDLLFAWPRVLDRDGQ